MEITQSNADTDHLSTLLELLSAKEDSLLELDRGIEQLTPLDRLEVEIANTEDYKERVILLKSRAQRMIKKTQDLNTLQARVSDANSNRSQTQSVRLPKLIIDQFYGDVSMWQEFWSQYETAIHNNDSLCKQEKFTYLKTYLAGPAAEAVAGLITDSNYDDAIALLKRRFGRKDLVVSAQLLNLTPVNKSSDLNALRQLYDECESIV